MQTGGRGCYEILISFKEKYHGSTVPRCPDGSSDTCYFDTFFASKWHNFFSPIQHFIVNNMQNVGNTGIIVLLYAAHGREFCISGGGQLVPPEEYGGQCRWLFI